MYQFYWSNLVKNYITLGKFTYQNSYFSSMKSCDIFNNLITFNTKMKYIFKYSQEKSHSFLITLEKQQKNN